MNIWHGLAEVPSGLAGSVVTIGVFDGLHRGHQDLVSRAVGEARRRGLPCVMVVFDPHPVSIFLHRDAPKQLATFGERLRLAEARGVDAVLAVNFTRELGGLSPRHYFTSLLLDTLKAKAVFVGENFTFGKDAEGTAETLTELGGEFGVEVSIVPLFKENGRVLCSSLAREALAEGDVATAAWVLGRRFSVTAKIVHGAGRGGAELGYPTANQYFPDSMALPGDGVYAGLLTVLDDEDIDGDMEPGRPYAAAISVGTNPTFGEEPRSVESFVLDREADLYGHTARVEFVERVRGMEAFDSVDELLSAMANDVARTREILRG